jgi:uncharacterized membrane protein YfcA
MTGWQFAAFLLCVVVASCTQAITGFAMALVLLGLTGLFDLAPLPDAANVATVLSLASAVVALRTGDKRVVDLPMLRATATGTVFGVAAGVALLAWLSGSVVVVLRLLLGLTIVACAIVVLMRTAPLPQRSSRLSFGLFGLLSGTLGGLFSASGPPLVYHYYRQPVALESVRDTLVAALAVSAFLRLGLIVASGQFTLASLRLCAVAVPMAMLITWLLRRYPPPLSRVVVLRLVCGLLVLTGIGLAGPAVHAIAARMAA